MAIDETLECTGCGRDVPAGESVEDRCACGDSLVDHHEGVDDGCRMCGCPTFEWDGTLACPACLEPLDDVAGDRAPARRAA